MSVATTSPIFQVPDTAFLRLSTSQCFTFGPMGSVAFSGDSDAARLVSSSASSFVIPELIKNFSKLFVSRGVTDTLIAVLSPFDVIAVIFPNIICCVICETVAAFIVVGNVAVGSIVTRAISWNDFSSSMVSSSTLLLTVCRIDANAARERDPVTELHANVS